MTHSYDDRAGDPVRSQTERRLALGVGVTLAVAGALSLVHLVDQYNKAGPFRAARAAEQAVRDAESDRRDAEWRAERDAEAARYASRGATSIPAPVIVPSEAPPTDLSQDEMRRLLAETGTPARTSQRESVSSAMRWSISPAWPTVGDEDFPPGVNRMTVRFHCQVSRRGVLSRCSATEQPAGTGLADRVRSALPAARMEPLIVDGRAVESTVNFAISYTPPPRPLVRPAPPPVAAEKPPADLPPSALPSADRLAAPPPPVPAPVPTSGG